MLTAYSFEDAIVTSTNLPTTANKTESFALNKDKQIESLGADTNLANFEVIINDDEKNVGIQCSTAFYEAVAKPVMFGLSKGTTLNINSISIHCNHIDFNRDRNCYEYNRVLHVKLGGNVEFSIGKVTIHLHHTKRLIQMQGGAIMPDGSRAPVWFLSVFIKERFTKLVELKKFDITAFNSMINKMVNDKNKNDILNNNCAKCLRQFSANSRPTQCICCKNYYHKSSCLPSHSLICHHGSSSTAAVSAAQSSLLDHQEPQDNQWI